MNITDKISVAELAYSAAVFVALIYAVRGLRGAWRDQANQRAAHKNGKRLLVAAVRFWMYIALVALYVFMTGFALQALTAPPPADRSRETLVTILICVYLALTIISAGATVYADSLWERLVDYIEEDRRTEEARDHAQVR